MEPIVLAVFPSVTQALPALERALAGPGKPDGVLSVRRSGESIVVEWDPSRTAVRLIVDLIDAELRRFAASRRTELLVPLSEERLAQIAAAELAAPEIAPDRILEHLLEEARLC
jgi:hypothetical protein